MQENLLLVREWLLAHKSTVMCLALFGFGTWGFFLFRSDAGAAKEAQQRFVRRSRSRFRAKLEYLYIELMRKLDDVPVLGEIVGNIRIEIQMNEALTSEVATKKTGQALLFSSIAFGIVLAVGVRWFGDFILALITAFMIGHIVLQRQKSNAKTFLTNLNDALDDFLLAYHKSSGNIDETFFVVENSKNPVARHFSVMHEYVRRAFVSSKPESIQSEYNTMAPSRYLRNLFAIVYMAYRHGDQIVDNLGMLDSNITEIQAQISEVLYQQAKLADETMGVRWSIVLPVYALPLLTKYMHDFFTFEGFEFIDKFLTSALGYTIQVICAVISLLCYLMYVKASNRRIFETRVRNTWEKKVLQDRHIRKTVRALAPDKSETYRKIRNAIAAAGANDTVEALEVRRLFLGTFTVTLAIISIFINTLSNKSSINNDIYTGLPKDNYTLVLMTQNDMPAYIDEMLAADKRVISHFRRDREYRRAQDDETRSELVRQYMKSSGDIEAYRGYEDYGIKRVVSKLAHLEMITGPFILLFIAGMGVIGFFLPLILVHLQAFINKDMILLDEITDLENTTLMMVGYVSTTPDSLLEWYSTSSILLAPEFNQCLVFKNFDEVTASVGYKPFTQLMNSLKMSYEGLSLKDAFSGVAQRLAAQKKKQGRVIERMLGFRISLSNTFASISMGSVIALYMFLPLMVAMVQMFMSLDIF